MKKVLIESYQCENIGKTIAALDFKESFLERDFLTINVSDELKTAMYYYAVGICHQTYHLANPELNLYGWDFLEYGFIDIAKNRPQLLEADYLVQLSTAQLAKEIRPFFAPQNIAEQCTLDNIEERCSFWIHMAELIKDSGLSHLEYIQKSNGVPNYFYKKLKHTVAYSDHLQKKTSFLMKLLEDAKLIQFSNHQDLIPIMDYHMQRVLLRTGCVEVLDNDLKFALQNKLRLQNEQELRVACISAMKQIAQHSGYSVFKMNDVFYTMGLSCCNQEALCQKGSCEKAPCTLALAVELDQHQQCIFEACCKGKNDEDYRKYWQPQVNTHYY
ncbi:hypothetical protein HNS38_16720 [Lentimicrobium sp. L6]|uniref:hypothetical protein n=1 Tax=Lentimicrobium sp. L6 TaxID=2735916 RepID=UPI00155272CF|nr:hypothetical protein [Lentimicrobium sp. L6]NPD86418.1 hypothetical protein [Lentimicrobium sp. L6]